MIQDSENAHELEPLLFVIKNLAGRAMARLAGRGERVTKFQLALEQEKHSLIKKPRRVWEFILPLPQGSTSGLLPLIKERLQTDLQRDPLESWVNYIKILITETVPGQYGQRNFFNKKEEEQEAWSSLIARLCQKLGKDHAFAAAPVESFKPENAWKRDWPDGGPAKAFNQNLTIFPQRPLRVLKDPIRIFKSDNFLQDQTQRWEIKDWDGPERLSGEWWDDEFARDYFRIGTKQGEQLWVYRIPDSDQLFLHGYFD